MRRTPGTRETVLAHARKMATRHGHRLARFKSQGFHKDSPILDVAGEKMVATCEACKATITVWMAHKHGSLAWEIETPAYTNCKP